MNRKSGRKDMHRSFRWMICSLKRPDNKRQKRGCEFFTSSFCIWSDYRMMVNGYQHDVYSILPFNPFLNTRTAVCASIKEKMTRVNPSLSIRAVHSSIFAVHFQPSTVAEVLFYILAFRGSFLALQGTARYRLARKVFRHSRKPSRSYRRMAP